MALTQLDEQIFAISRTADVVVTINGEVIASGLGAESNLKGVEVAFDIDQLPPTATLTMVNIPSWVQRRQDVTVDAGYDGHLERLFTGYVKRRRHNVQGDTIECAGRTEVLTQPFRSPLSPKSFAATTGAVVAINDILDDLANPPTANIDPILKNDGTDFEIATVKPVFMDSAPASDMIRQIADVYGYRVYETRAGVLRIRPPLEAPQPTGFRTYGTQGTGQLTETVISHDETNIDGAVALGNIAANTRRAQQFAPAVDGSASRVSFWMRKVGAPTDSLRFVIAPDDFLFNPNEPAPVVWASAPLFPGQVLSVGSYIRVDILLTNVTPWVSGLTFHLIVDRTGALDAVNYYEIGADSGAGFAGGIANVFDGASWSADGGDLTFEIVTIGLPTLRLLNIADDEDENQVKKEAIVHGATVPSTTASTIDDPGGDETQTQITANRHTDDNSLVEGPFELYSMVYQNELIQDIVVADEVAQRLVNKYHRILDSIEVEVPFDPRISLGQTIKIDDKEPVPDVLPREVTGLNGNWWIRSYRHLLNATSVSTNISLFGGDQSGTDSEANPQPDFTFRIERELIGNAIQAVITFTSTSVDMDGEIVDYHWVDDYAGGVNDVQGGEDFREVTFAYDPSVDSEINMTLTVTDDDGNTASITITIDTTTGNEEVYTPVIVCAAANTCMATFDGALTWVDIATPSGEARVAEVTHDNDPDNPMILFFGTTTGRIYRSQDDLASLTLVSDQGSAHPIVDIKADKHVRRRIWAVTSTGRVLRSTDRGVTFSLYHDLGAQWSHRHDADLTLPFNAPGHVDPRPLSGIQLSPPNVNRIWVFGGRGTDPESWVHTNDLGDSASTWFSEIANAGHGDTEASSAAVSTGNASDTVIDIEKSNPSAGDLGVAFSGRNPPFMYASRYRPQLTAQWRNGGLLPDVDSVGLEGNNGQRRKFGMLLDNQNFYRFVPFEGGGQSLNLWEVFADVLPGTGANRPNDLLNLTRWPDIYLAATDEGIVKSIDFGESWDFIRPVGAPINTVWPGGAIGWNVAVEYRRPRSFDLLTIVSSHPADPTVENALAARRGAGGWEDRGPLPTGRSIFPHRLWHFPQIDDQTLFFIKYDSGLRPQLNDLYRSEDLGSSWAVNQTLAGTVARGPDGRLWCSRENHAVPTGHAGTDPYPHAIYFSDDNGDTWTLAYVDSRTVANIPVRFFSIAVDPTNASRLMAVGTSVGDVQILVTEDAHLGASATWTEVSPTPSLTVSGSATRYHQPNLIAADGGRWVLAFSQSGPLLMVIWTSDNNGTDWARRDSVSISGSTFGYSELLRAGNYLLALGSMISATNAQHRRSDDNGQTWQALTQLTGADAHAWDSRVDMLIASEGDGIHYMQPPEVGQLWHPGLEVGLEAAMGYTNPPESRENGLAIRGV